MMDEKQAWRVWITGLVLFAITVALSVTVTRNGVTLGITEHQQAGTAVRADEIQAAWNTAGVRGNAMAAMLADLVFIGVFAWGSYLLGRVFSGAANGLIRVIGLVVVTSAIVFGLTDYIETILQFTQLLLDKGSDWMAGTAATVRPVKILTFCIAFFGIMLALVVRRFSQDPA